MAGRKLRCFYFQFFECHLKEMLSDAIYKSHCYRVNEYLKAKSAHQYLREMSDLEGKLQREKNYPHADRSGFHFPSAGEKGDEGDNFLKDSCILILFLREGRCDV